MSLALLLRRPAEPDEEYVVDDAELLSGSGDRPSLNVLVDRATGLLRDRGLLLAGQADRSRLLSLVARWREGLAATDDDRTLHVVPLAGTDASPATEASGRDRGAGDGRNADTEGGQFAKPAWPSAPPDRAVREALSSDELPLLLVYDDHVEARKRLQDLCTDLGRKLYLWTRADGWHSQLPGSVDEQRMLAERQPIVALSEALEAVKRGALGDTVTPAGPQPVVVAFQDLPVDFIGSEQVLSTAVPSLGQRLRDIGGLLVLLAPRPALPPSWTPFRVVRFRTGSSPTPLLERFGDDLTLAARLGRLHAIAGRTSEREAIKIGLRMPPGASSAPLLYGDKGTGKSAILEQLALDLSESTDERERQLRVISIRMASLVAGTSLQGTLEERVQEMIEEAEESSDRIILVFDEIHTLADSPAALEALKEPLARGRIKLVGATTPADWATVERHHEAFASRFRKIHVSPPNLDETVAAMGNRADEVLRRAFPEFEWTDADLKAIAEASRRHLPSEPLPRRPISLLFELATRSGGTGRLDLAQLDVVLSEITGAKVGALSSEERRVLSDLRASLANEIFGQDEAVEIVAGAVASHRLGWNGDRPTVLLFVGDTGTGKTETAKAINRQLMPGHDLVTFNMETYGADRHAGMSLLGAPASYVGHEEGSQLVNLARNFPYRCVLLDEFEKADSGVIIQLMNILYEGRYTDPRGLLGDFRRWFFCLTTNVLKGAELTGTVAEVTERLTSKFADPHRRLGPVPQEVLGRVSRVVPFRPLDGAAYKRISRKKLDEFALELARAHVELRIEGDDAVVGHLAKQALSRSSGARAIDQLLSDVRYRAPEEWLRSGKGTLVIRVVDDQLRHDWE